MDTPLGMSWGLASWAVGRLCLSRGLPGILTLLCFHLIHSFLHQRARVWQGLCSGLNEMTVPCRLRHLNTWSQVSGSIWGVLGNVSLLGELCYCRRTLFGALLLLAV